MYYNNIMRLQLLLFVLQGQISYYKILSFFGLNRILPTVYSLNRYVFKMFFIHNLVHGTNRSTQTEFSCCQL